MSLPTEPLPPITLRDLLLDNLNLRCSLDDIQDFCFRLHIEYENLPGATRAEKSRQLIMHLEKLSRVRELVLLGKRLRNDLVWELPLVATDQVPLDGSRLNQKPTTGSSSPIPTPLATPEPIAALSDLLTLDHPFFLELVRVPAGKFLMGSSYIDQAAEDREKPQHPVHLDEYFIGKYEINVAQFATFVRATGHETTAEQMDGGYTGAEWKGVKGADWRHPRGPDSNVSGKQDHPATLVSWDDAMAFCQWLSRVTGWNVQLPTEAQWEKAARGTDGRIYPWGNEWDGKRLNSKESKLQDTTRVGSYSPAGDSPYGATDMAGNVWEWTASLLKSYPYLSDDGREDAMLRGDRVMRGGSWFRGAKHARCSYRSGDPTIFRTPFVGFRVVVQSPPVSQFGTLST